MPNHLVGLLLLLLCFRYHHYCKAWVPDKSAQALPPSYVENMRDVLHEELQNHRFGFIIGAPHSGTTLIKLLMGQHQNVSNIVNKNIRNNEAQFFQTVYPPHVGLNHNWSYTPEMHLTELSTPYNTIESRDQLYAEWRRYWNVSKPVLIEKSPRHMLMTRLLQHWFTAERTFFVVVLRHPLATMKEMWTFRKIFNFSDCGENAIIHWLKIQRQLFEDMAQLHNVVLFHYEHFALGQSQEYFTRVMAQLDLPGSVPVPTVRPYQIRRPSREYRGAVSRPPLVHQQLVYDWIIRYGHEARRMPAQCAHVVARYLKTRWPSMGTV